MKRTCSVFALSTLCLLIGLNASAEEDATWGNIKERTEDLISTLGAGAAKVVNQNADVIIDGPAPGTSSGMATIKRKKNGINFKIDATGLDAHHVYTLWLVEFENPAACNLNCNGEDLGVADGTIMGPVAAGSANANGQRSFVGHVKADTFIGGFTTTQGDNSTQVGDGELNNPATGEFHFVVRSHGAPIPGQVPEQMKHFNGGCGGNLTGPPDAGLPCTDALIVLFF